MLNRHRLSAPDFSALSMGLGSASTIAALRSAQFSWRLIGLRAVLDAAERTGHGDVAGLSAGLDLLSSVQQHDDDAVAVVLGYPFAGAWAAHCLRLLSGVPGGNAADLGYLGCMGAAAAIRAGLSFSIEVPVRGGAVCLPTLGRLMVSNGTTATVRSDGAKTTIGGVPLAEAHGWQPLRYCTASAAGQSFTVTLDDVDPFRGAGGLALTGRLSDPAACAWESMLGAAWSILVRDHNGYADAIGAGMLTLVPLLAAQPNRGVNATSRESFGASAMSRPPDPVTLAAALVHEFQHAKLNALVDLMDLYRPAETRHYAPWREDPRPIGGLLHGAYAYLGVSDFWRTQATVATDAAYAQMEFARWSDRTSRVMDVLLNSGDLTATGECFVQGMRARITTLTAGVPDEPGQMARTASADHRLRWRLRNVRHDARTIERLVHAWLAGEPIPLGEAGRTELAGDGLALGASTRLDLLHLRLREPVRLADEADLTSFGIAATGADLAFAAGDLAAAAAQYRVRIAAEPQCLDAWAGLALALRGTGHGRGAVALLNGPEVVYAVHNGLLKATGSAPDPEAIAGWLAPMLAADPWQLPAAAPVSGPVPPIRTL